MKHSERHAFKIFFDIELFNKGGYEHMDINMNQLQYELTLFRGAWRSAKTTINFGQGGNYVEISYEDFPNCYEVCYQAAENFREVVKRNHWWKEVIV